MTHPLPVYTVTLPVGNRTLECVIAASSKATAADAFLLDPARMRKHGRETTDADAIDAANSEPGATFVRIAGRSLAWVPLREVH